MFAGIDASIPVGSGESLKSRDSVACDAVSTPVRSTVEETLMPSPGGAVSPATQVAAKINRQPVALPTAALNAREFNICFPNLPAALP